MSASPRLTPPVARPSGEAAALRVHVIARAWSELGEAVAPLSNGSGRPLARTVKLILEPLVIRPVQNPHLAGAALTEDAAIELAGRIAAAGDDLAATGEWFGVLKRARRARGITDGNPQERYFQRCFELARTEGRPVPGAATTEAIADETVAEIAQAGGESVLARVRDLLIDEDASAAFVDRLAAAWSLRAGERSAPIDPARVSAALDACGARDAASDFDALRTERAGTAAGAELAERGVARLLGLTEHETPPLPRLGATASKRELPWPFDRSIYERLFAALSGGAPAEIGLDAEDVLADEIARSAAPWELATEQSRVVMLLGAEASHALEPTALLRPTNAHRMLRDRWDREAYVRRVRRLPAGATGVPENVESDIRTVRQGYLRRLWVRLHGRELRGQVTNAAELWDTLDGILRSVIMDQRHRLKTALGRDLEGAA
ncbi:hypothetical protein M2317_001254 [Microbacterium sp. ZKA21]|uniref:hypothetical protein n=1 Tax=Microbacterium sp. ZKA21 TaxID=3381694 RepID=UPI003D1F90A8